MPCNWGCGLGWARALARSRSLSFFVAPLFVLLLWWSAFPLSRPVRPVRAPLVIRRLGFLQSPSRQAPSPSPLPPSHSPRGVRAVGSLFIGYRDVAGKAYLSRAPSLKSGWVIICRLAQRVRPHAGAGGLQAQGARSRFPQRRGPLSGSCPLHDANPLPLLYGEIGCRAQPAPCPLFFGLRIPMPLARGEVA